MNVSSEGAKRLVDGKPFHADGKLFHAMGPA